MKEEILEVDAVHLTEDVDAAVLFVVAFVRTGVYFTNISEKISMSKNHNIILFSVFLNF